MKGRTNLAALGCSLALLASAGFASLPYPVAAGVERLADGNTLIANTFQTSDPSCRAIVVDTLGRLVWAYLKSDVPWIHTARRLSNGNTLLTATNANRVKEVNPVGDSVWAFSTGLNYPNDAQRLANGNTLITDRDNNRVIEVEPDGTIVWSYANLLGPHNGTRLANGNTLICDSEHNRVVEVDSAGTVVWQYATALAWPRSAQRLANGHTLIADSGNNRVIEVDSSGVIRWRYAYNVVSPFAAVRLANGNTLITALPRVVEVTADTHRVWQYPPTPLPPVETLRVYNPASGCSLYVHIHRPPYASPTNPQPGVILVPAEGGVGTDFDTDTLANDIASDGFVVLHFDPDGQGRSGTYPANYGGYVNQDGLQACALALAQRPYVDTARLGIYATSYGITMASGTIARHPDSPRISFLLDFEGPADRSQTCQDSGDYIPVPADSEAFWQEREAARFMKNAPVAYLRIQTQIDHNPHITDNRHCIALIDSATAANGGLSPWTRVNDSAMNPANRTYTLSDPPVYIPETQEVQNVPRILLYLHELARLQFPPSAFRSSPCPSSLAAGPALELFPNPVANGSVRVHLRLPRGHDPKRFASGPCPLTDARLRFFDASGRQAAAHGLTAARSRLQDSVFDLRISDLPPGIYFLQLTSGDFSATARMVKTR
jgi:hypothetical protein